MYNNFEFQKCDIFLHRSCAKNKLLVIFLTVITIFMPSYLLVKYKEKYILISFHLIKLTFNNIYFDKKIRLLS